MWSQRSTIDYALARRATLTSLLTGRRSTTDVCDADPYLLRAAQYHGEGTTKACPICRHHYMTHVTYVFGEELASSQAGSRRPQRLRVNGPRVRRVPGLRRGGLRTAHGTTWRPRMCSAMVCIASRRVASAPPKTTTDQITPTPRHPAAERWMPRLDSNDAGAGALGTVTGRPRSDLRRSHHRHDRPSPLH